MAVRKKQKKAFTIVEFLLAMTFLATLLMGIATLTMRVLDIYRKGLSMRAINSNGRDILNDLSRTIAGSPLGEKINPKPANKIKVEWDDVEAVYRDYYNEIYMNVNTVDKNNITTTKHVQAGGVFCTGSYSYIWNTAPAIEAVRKDESYLNSMLTINGKYYKFARIPDTEREACAHTAIEGNPTTDGKLTNIHITFDDPHNDRVVNLISDDESDLALYDFSVLPATQNEKTGSIFYAGTFTIATMSGGVNVLSSGDFCTGSDQMFGDDVEAFSGDFNYCAVNKFNFAMRATGETSNADQYGER